MTKRTIKPHKGGRTARAPDARIRPQTLQRIHEAMREQGKTFADLLEDTYQGGNEMSKLNAFNGSYFEVWYNRGGKGAHCIAKSVYAKDEKDAIKKATAAAPANLDMSKVTAQKV